MASRRSRSTPPSHSASEVTADGSRPTSEAASSVRQSMQSDESSIQQRKHLSFSEPESIDSFPPKGQTSRASGTTEETKFSAARFMSISEPETSQPDDAGPGRKMRPQSWCSRASTVSVKAQRSEVIYKRAAPIIRNPLMPPTPCCFLPAARGKTSCRSKVFYAAGPDKSRLYAERDHYREYKSACGRDRFAQNPCVATPMTARPFRGRRKGCSLVTRKAEDCNEWEAQEERLKNYRDHLLAENIGYETLVGNLLYIDIPGGKDINRSWQNFLSDDVMEWGFPYYKASKERPRVKQKEPYLAHMLKEKLWRYPKTRMFHASMDD